MKDHTMRDDTLTPAIVKVVLLGPLAIRLSELSSEDQVMVAWLTKEGPHGYAELWRQHSPFLLSEAQRLGIRPVYGNEFFSAAIVRREDEASSRQMVAASTYRTSVHESGHAVLAAVFGIPVATVRIADRRSALAIAGYVSYGGRPRSIDDDDAAMRKELDDERAAGEWTAPTCPGPLAESCLVALAGVVAEHRAGVPDTGYTGSGWHDLFCVEHYLARALSAPPWGAQVHSKISTLERVTRRLVDANWGAIERCARELRRRKHLTGADIDRLTKD